MKSKNHTLFLLQIIFMNSFITLTSGVFMSGLAIYMGASDIIISLISTISYATGIFVLLFASKLSRSKSCRKLTITITAISRGITYLIVLIPLIVPESMRLVIFLPTLIIAFTLQGIALVSLNNWLAYYTPNNSRGNFISRRQILALITTVIFSLSAGKLMDYFKNNYKGFLIIFSIATLMSIIEIFVLTKINDSENNESQDTKIALNNIIKSILKNKTFINYVIYVSLFYMFLYLSDSFSMLYQLKYLKLSYSTITSYQLIMSLPQIPLLYFWGKASDRFGHKFVLQTSIWFFIGELIFFLFTTTNSYYITIPLAYAFGALGNSAFTLSLFNRRYEIIPENCRIVYDSFFNTMVGLAFIAGPLLGGLLHTFFQKVSQHYQLFTFADIRLLYLVSIFLISILQIGRLFYKPKDTSISCINNQ